MISAIWASAWCDDMKDVLPVWGLAIIVVLTMPPLAAGSDSVAVPSGGAQYAYNKNNPRWEAPQHVPVKKFHKPYKPLRQPPGALPGRHQRGSMFLSADVVIGLTSIVVLSVAAQWVSWSIGLPAALVSIVFGIAAGPAGGFLDPDILLGNLLLPTLSLLLALVIFDACRRLRFSELPKTKGTTTSLVSIGLLSTWLVGAGTAYLAAGFDGPLAVLIGAVLVAIGPTTIAELTQHTRLPRWLGAVVAWEAALTELVGMVLTILLFIGIAYGHFHGWPPTDRRTYPERAGLWAPLPPLLAGPKVPACCSLERRSATGCCSKTDCCSAMEWHRRRIIRAG